MCQSETELNVVTFPATRFSMLWQTIYAFSVKNVCMRKITL